MAGDDGSGGGDAVRARILAVARRQFFRLGFAGCTMDALAQELGMSKKTLYRHFARKEEIVDTLLTAKTDAMRAGFEAAVGAEGVPFPERAARMLRHAHTELAEVSAVFLNDLRRFMPASYARMEEFRARVAPVIWERLMRLGIEVGAVRSDVDPVFLGRLIPTAMQSLLHPDTLDRFGLQPHEMLQRFFQLMFMGVLTPEGLADHARFSKRM